LLVAHLGVGNALSGGALEHAVLLGTERSLDELGAVLLVTVVVAVKDTVALPGTGNTLQIVALEIVTTVDFVLSAILFVCIIIAFCHTVAHPPFGHTRGYVIVARKVIVGTGPLY